MQRIAHDIAELVVEFGGSLSGEHGDGLSRSEFLPLMFGPELIALHQQVKAVFDPAGLMNPGGKIVPPYQRMSDNLRLGAYARRGDPARFAPLAQVFALFPRLQERLGQRAETLSGGEQQMLAVARAFMARPRLLLLDEASLGLAPSTAKNVYDAIARLRVESGIAMLVVEQNANLAFRLVDSATVLETGRNVLTGTSAELKGMDEIRRAYLGG